MQRSRIIAAGCFIAAAIGAEPASASDVFPWVTAAAHPYAEAQRVAVAATDGRIFLFGGRADPVAAHVYDPVTDAFAPLSDLPVATAGACGSQLSDGRIAIFGGIDPAATTYVSALQLYTPATNTWTVGPSASGGWQCAAVADAAGRLHVFGGESRQTRYSIYTAATDTWADGPTMPIARHSHGAVRGSDGRLYVFGGHYDKQSMSIYDPSLTTWTAGPPLPAETQQFGWAVGGDFVYVLGGTDSYADDSAPYFDGVSIYDTVAGTWTVDSDVLVSPVREAAAAMVGDEIHLFGGSNGAMVAIHQVASIAGPLPPGPGGSDGGSTGGDDGGSSGTDGGLGGTDDDGGGMPGSTTTSTGTSGAGDGSLGDDGGGSGEGGSAGAGAPGADAQVGCTCRSDGSPSRTAALLLGLLVALPSRRRRRGVTR